MPLEELDESSMVSFEVLLVETLLLREVDLDVSTQEAELFNRLGSRQLVPLLELPLDLLVVSQSQEVLQDLRVSDLRVFDEVIQEESQHHLLSLDKLQIGC